MPASLPGSRPAPSWLLLPVPPRPPAPRALIAVRIKASVLHLSLCLFMPPACSISTALSPHQVSFLRAMESGACTFSLGPGVSLLQQAPCWTGNGFPGRRGSRDLGSDSGCLHPQLQGLSFLIYKMGTITGKPPGAKEGCEVVSPGPGTQLMPSADCGRSWSAASLDSWSAPGWSEGAFGLESAEMPLWFVRRCSLPPLFHPSCPQSWWSWESGALLCSRLLGYSGAWASVFGGASQKTRTSLAPGLGGLARHRRAVVPALPPRWPTCLPGEARRSVARRL